ncbi:MAG: aldo/keto reductase [Treponema sp.]|jgi:aryl-alcohol dehydrogenase-like predicted oxidoreductase|nr:aldo/keto reductase [Treponema sp.]
MEYRKLGRSNVKVSRLCLGTGNFGYGADFSGNWGCTGEAEAFKIMDAALEAGINFFDCANVYGNHGAGKSGASEQIIGKWFKQGGGRREKVFMATKVGRAMFNNDYDDLGNANDDYSLWKLRRHIEGCFERLETDHIEMISLHHVDRNVQWDEIWEAFEGFIRSGHLDYAGASKFAGWELMKAQEAARNRHFMGFICEQHRYDMIYRNAELEAFPACMDQGIGVTLFSPLQRGVLAVDLLEPGKNRPIEAQSAPLIQKYRNRLLEYARLCRDLGESPANVTLAWEMRHPGVTSPIIGPATLADLEELLHSLEITLNDDVLAEIDRIFPPPQPLFYDEKPPFMSPPSWN